MQILHFGEIPDVGEITDVVEIHDDTIQGIPRGDHALIKAVVLTSWGDPLKSLVQ